MHKCPRCNYESKFKNDLRRHYTRKRLCIIINKNVTMKDCLKLLEDPNHVLDETVILKKNITNKDIKIQELENIIQKQQEEIIYKDKIIINKEKEIQILKQTQTDKDKKEYNQECIYLILERELVNNTIKVGKLGISKTFRNRMGDYPKGSKIIHVKRCLDASKAEKELLILFNLMFNQKTDIGKEYFEGDLDEMSKQIDSYFYNQNKKIS